MDNDRQITPAKLEAEETFELSLRPKVLGEYIGQEKLKENLSIFIKAAKGRSESLDHVLLYGPPGLGKTTLANIIATEIGANISTTSGPAIEKPGDLAAILTNLEEGDVLFVDEIHRLSTQVEEILYPAMEDFTLDIIIGQGPSARSVKLDLPKFTLIGATTRAGLLSSPLRDRFGIVSRLEFYTDDELATIVRRSASILNIPVTDDGALEVARRSRGTPRIANRLLKRVRDFAEVKADGEITIEVAEGGLKMLDIDDMGMDNMDRRLLITIIDKFSGGPVGVESLAAALNEERDAIEDLYEPYLIQEGYMHRSPRGRMATELAYKHVGRVFKKTSGESGDLF